MDAADDSNTRESEVYDLFRTSSGFAAGSTVSEALLHAINEVIERDALSNYLVGRLSGQTSSLEVKPPKALHPLLASVARTPAVGQTPRMHLIESLAGYVVVAECGRGSSQGRLDIGCGASADPLYAMERALLELVQERLASTTTSDPAPVDLMDRSLDGLGG